MNVSALIQTYLNKLAKAVFMKPQKVQFYQRRHQREANRKIVISPMVADNAQKVAKNLGIEVYSHARDVEVS